MSGQPTGFYGKVPAKGDFISRRLPAAIVEPWDAWLRQGMAASQAGLGDRWLALYLSAPIWRFVLAPGLCGTKTVIGLLMPSVDRVSRYFPLTLAVSSGYAGPAWVAVAAEQWFAAAEALALEALGEAFDFDDWDRRVEGLAWEPPALPAAPPADLGRGDLLCIPLGRGGNLASAVPALASRLLQDVSPYHSLWWTMASATVEPRLVMSPGLPPADAFADFLSVTWEPSGISRGSEPEGVPPSLG